MTALDPATDTAPLDDRSLASYLERIGVADRPAPDLPSLQRLVAAHTSSIPFEALDPYTVREPGLTSEALVDKLVRTRRGGWCFEHNGLLRRALDALGFATTGLTARVRWGWPESAAPTARAHMALRVDLPDGPYLADVGFGGMVPTGALALEPDAVQRTPLEPFRLLLDPDTAEWTLEALVGDAWKALYTFDLTPTPQIDYEMANHYLVHHPNSLFRTGLLAVLPGDDRRTNLEGRSVTVHHVDGPSERTDLDSPSAVRDALEERIGVDTSGIDGLDTRLDALFASAWG